MTDKITTLLDSNKGLNLSLESTNKAGYLSDITCEEQKEEDILEIDNPLDPGTILTMTLSGIFKEIRSQEETNISSDILPLEQQSEEDNLDVGNNENALDAEIILSMTLSGIDN